MWDRCADSHYLRRCIRPFLYHYQIIGGSMPSSRTSLASLVLLTLVALVLPAVAAAHGFAAKRFFPATLTFDDPFTMDEFDIQYGSGPGAGGGGGGGGD